MLEDRAAACQRLETAIVSAGAPGAINVDDHVPNFTSGTIQARMKLAIQDQPRADAGADENANEITRLGFQFSMMNADGANIRIIFDANGDP